MSVDDTEHSANNEQGRDDTLENQCHAPTINVIDEFEALPVQISAHENVLAMYPVLKKALHQIEAHINFKTLAAAWYENEDDIIDIDCNFLTPDHFNTLHQSEREQTGYINIADDVFYLFDQNSQKLYCHIQITPAEGSLFITQPKVIKPLLEKKIIKILNVIAKEHALFPL